MYNDFYTMILIQWFVNNDPHTTISIQRFLYNDFYTTIFVDSTNDYILLEKNHIVGTDPQKSLYPGPVAGKSLAGDTLLPTVFDQYNDFGIASNNIFRWDAMYLSVSNF